MPVLLQNQLLGFIEQKVQVCQAKCVNDFRDKRI